MHPTAQKFYKVIACEIAFRELSYCASRSPNLVELEFLTQGHHDTPSKGRIEIQNRINAVPNAKYDAILLGYGLCSNILSGLTSPHTPLVIPRAHDCITFFLGSRERYNRCFAENPGTYYFTSGWLECARRRGLRQMLWAGTAQLPTWNSASPGPSPYEDWVEKYGKEQADFLLEEMARWTSHYSCGHLIRFDFLHNLCLEQQVQQVCRQQNWSYVEAEGDLNLLQSFVDGTWPEADFLILQPGERVCATFDDSIIRAEQASKPA